VGKLLRFRYGALSSGLVPPSARSVRDMSVEAVLKYIELGQD